MKTVLIFGIKGGLAQLVSKQLLKNPNFRILGVDNRPVDDTVNDPRLDIQHVRYTRTEIERIFALYKPDYVLHLARVSQSKVQSFSMKHRLQVNVLATQHILDLCLYHHVKRVVVLSTGHVYGALCDNPAFIIEEAPLRASLEHPELRDVVQMDQLASSWLWQHQAKTQGVVLRPCSVLGPHIKNAMSSFLRSPLGFSPTDYNPMMQFIHELDMANILVQSLHDLPCGIYNVAGRGHLDLHSALELLSPERLKLPISVIAPIGSLLKRVGIGPATYLLDYLKYPCLLSVDKLNQSLAKLDHFKWQYTSKEALLSLKANGSSNATSNGLVEQPTDEKLLEATDKEKEVLTITVTSKNLKKIEKKKNAHKIQQSA